MEVIIAAAIAAFGSVIVAMLARSGSKSAHRDAVMEDIRSKLQTNGSKKEVGVLVELIYQDLQDTKRDLADHERDREAHGLQIWERRGM